MALWHKLRDGNEPPLKTAARSVNDLIAAAKREGYQWVFIDTPPNTSPVVEDAIRAATMVIIPARPGVFDVNSVQETIRAAATARKPYAVVISGAPARRDDRQPDRGAGARRSSANSGRRSGPEQITSRADLVLALGPGHGEGAKEYSSEGRAASEGQPVARRDRAVDQGDPRRRHQQRHHA
ncbi:MAG: ParA family protein [Rhodopseudomonas palustris]|nr:ParA family protein [Rhodopseudomonas palustris]